MVRRNAPIDPLVLRGLADLLAGVSAARRLARSAGGRASTTLWVFPQVAADLGGAGPGFFLLVRWISGEIRVCRGDFVVPQVGEDGHAAAMF